MTDFYEKLIHFLQKELPAVDEAINQEQSLPELIRLQRTRAMMKELLDHALFYNKGKGIT